MTDKNKDWYQLAAKYTEILSWSIMVRIRTDIELWLSGCSFLYAKAM